jgi:hypothetical protein
MDKATDFFWGRKYHIRPISYHSRSNYRWGIALRSVLAYVRFEPQIAFPEISGLAVRRSHSIGVATVIDRLHAVLRVELFEVRYRIATHHAWHAARLAAALRWW